MVYRLFFGCILCCFFITNLKAQEQSDLESIQQQIKNKQEHISRQLEAAKKLQDNLKVVELQIAQSVLELSKIEISLNDNRQQMIVLRKQQKGYLTSLDAQKSVLAKQIRSAYMTGNYDFAKMLLNQQDAANFERTITYYQYLNKARKLQIDNFNLLVKDLQKVNANLIENQSDLKQLKSKQLEQQQTLTLNQINREKTLLSMQNAIESDEAKIAQLQINEKNLLEASLEFQYLSSPAVLSDKIEKNLDQKYNNLDLSQIYLNISDFISEQKKTTSILINEDKKK